MHTLENVVKSFTLFSSLDQDVDVLICVIAITLVHEKEDFTIKVLEFNSVRIVKLCEFKKLGSLFFMNEKYIVIYYFIILI